MQRLFRLSTGHTSTKTDLIIWPESATPFLFQNEPAYHEQVSRTLQRSNAWLLFGSPSYTQFRKQELFLQQRISPAAGRNRGRQI